MKILIVKNTDARLPYFTLTQDHLDAIRATAPDAELIAEDDTAPALADHISTADIILLSSNYTIELEQAKNLKWVHVSFAGIDNLPQTIRDRGCLITNSSGVHPIPIAEYVMGTMLLLTKEFLHYYRLQQKNTWRKDLAEVQPQELYQKRITIVGAGRIGMRVAELAHAFGMHVTGVVRDQSKQREHLDEVYQTDKLHDAVKEADFVVNILPLTKETEGIYNKQFFQAMKKSACFINVGRGKSVDEEALADALEAEQIQGAAMDVAADEPLSPTSRLWQFDNVFVTPHISSSTNAYMDRVIAIFCENLKAYLVGEKLPNLVDIQRGY